MLAQRLRQARKSKGYTQEELAKLVNTKKTTISNYETGYSTPSNEMLVDLANVLNTTADYLLGRTDDPSPNEGKLRVINTDIELSPEELKVVTEMKKHPQFAVMFHDLATAPEKTVKTLIKMWEVIKADLDEEDDSEDIIED